MRVLFWSSRRCEQHRSNACTEAAGEILEKELTMEELDAVRFALSAMLR